MNINLNQLDNYLSKNNIASDFLLVGDDFGQIVYVTDNVLKKYFGDDQFYIDTFYYSNLQKDSSLLQNALQALQLFTEKKAIIIKEVGENIKKVILDIIENKNDSFLLILQGENLRKSSKTYKELESMKKLCLVKCYKLDMNSTAIFIDKFLQSYSVKYKRELPDVITCSLPDNVLLIKNELEKVVQYLGQEELTIEVVEKVISGTKDFSYIDLCTAIAFKDKDKMLEQLKRINSEGVSFINIIRMLQNYFARVLHIKKEEKLKGDKAYNIINDLKPPVFFKEKTALLEICNKFNYDGVVDLMYELIKLEIDCKVITFNPNTLLHNYLIQKELCHTDKKDKLYSRSA